MPLMATGRIAPDREVKMEHTTYITAPAVAELLSINRSTVWRKAAAGDLPKPIRIAGGTRWSKAEIMALIEAKLAERGQS